MFKGVRLSQSSRISVLLTHSYSKFHEYLWVAKNDSLLISGSNYICWAIISKACSTAQLFDLAVIDSAGVKFCQKKPEDCFNLWNPSNYLYMVIIHLWKVINSFEKYKAETLLQPGKYGVWRKMLHKLNKSYLSQLPISKRFWLKLD